MQKFLSLNIELKKYFNLERVKKFLISFYIIGLIGFIVPYTFQIFKYLTAPVILFNVVLLTIFHQGIFDKKTFFIFFLIFVSGFVVETIGVNTGIIFGKYSYGNVLGPKIFNTPLIIGLNWLMLSYLSISIFDICKINVFFKIILASLLMLFYDIVIEHIAPIIDMWHWVDDKVPLQNYIAWFVISLFFTGLIKLTGIGVNNLLSRFIMILQLLFFSLLVIFFKFVK